LEPDIDDLDGDRVGRGKVGHTTDVIDLHLLEDSTMIYVVSKDAIEGAMIADVETIG
jgi:hypothetical protein